MVDAGVVLAWFRRDLRLADQRMLAAATASAGRVVPVFVADPAILARHAGARARVAWYRASLAALDAELRTLGSGLVVVEGAPAERLAELAARVGARAVFATRDEEPAGVARDAAVARRIDLHLVDDQRVVPPGTLRSGSGQPYAVFTPFRRALAARLDEDPSLIAEAVPRLDRLAPDPGPDAAAALAAFPAAGADTPLPPAGHAAAASRLAAFAADALERYGGERDRPSAGVTSRLSPYLRVGALSVRAAWRAAREAGPAGEAWSRELAWRELFAHRLAAGAFAAAPDGEPAWAQGTTADEALDAWREGRTGIPFVDAGMRELATTGWMHNRARMVAASFLVKHLGVDWRRGEAVFMERLLDGDPAQNMGNWRWVAGLGTGAAPWFRVLNPVTQSRRFDPDGIYLRRWLPELADLGRDQVHAPWTVAASRRRGYPEPMVDLGAARADALWRYRAARSTASP